MQHIPQCLHSALSLDGTLIGVQLQKRRLFFTLSVIPLVVLALLTFIDLRLVLAVPVQLVTRTVAIATCICGVTLTLCKVPLNTAAIVGLAYVFAAVFMVSDLNSRTYGGEFWANLVLVVDFLLVMQVDATYSVGLVVAVVVWLAVLSMEERYRFGLLDLPGLYPQEGEFGRRSMLERNLGCTDLPCPNPSVGKIFTAVQVFVIDFIATRSFARSVLKEQEAMQRTIATVQDIASLLAGYDVEGVARMLEAQETLLPEEMRATLQTLEENLRKYRPYLPAALFEEDEVDGVQHTSVAPPGLETETATIVFTDIRASTSIWECAPDGMSAGLKIHNRVMREVMAVFGGYEVKTIGDAFMIAFETTADGVNFALQVHEKLLAADWPASLLEDAPICTPQDSLWGGLTVRIGVNTGPVTVEQNTLTGRTDYFGHTVNVASRLESTCTPGAVAVPSDLWTSDCAACSGVVGETEALELKGVSGGLFVCCVRPVSLEARARRPLQQALRVSRLSPSARGSSVVSQLSPHMKLSTRVASSTVGVAELAVDDSSTSAIHSMNAALTSISVSLEQSSGSLITVLGSRVCVSWNVTRSAPAHMENAVRFAQRMLAKCILNGAGFVTGPVQHGDVGARTQRFVTVMGGTVRRSWTLCAEAVRDRGECLFVPLEGTAVPSALDSLLVQDHSTGCYRVRCEH